MLGPRIWDSRPKQIKVEKTTITLKIMLINGLVQNANAVYVLI